jgi:hypothetical protein
MKKIIAGMGLLLLGVTSQSRAQGMMDGFMRGQRKASLAITASQETFDSYYVNTTEIRDPTLGTVTTQALNAYGVYGLDYDLDFIVSASYARTDASAGYVPKQEGFQDIYGALRWEAFDFNFGKKARLAWLFALGYQQPLQNYVSDGLVTLGRGSRNFDGRTMLHFKGSWFFITAQYGYIRRGQVTLDRVINYYDPAQVNPNSGSTVNVPDVTEAILRAGITTKHLYLDGWVQRQKPYATGTDIAPGVPFPTNAVGFTRAGATLYLPLVKKFGLTGTYSTTLDGRNTGKATRLSGGIIIGI